ncbi:MAG: cyclic-phosphate processing receiver domain-containing protein [Hormoscilla sp.]
MNIETPPLRILIVEDTADRQEILRSLYRAHAWVMVDSSHRAISLIRAYSFDLISLDYNIQGEEEGDAVARAILETANRTARIIIHSMNPKGSALISSILPDAIAFPVNKMIASNARFKQLRERIDREGIAFDWQL